MENWQVIYVSSDIRNNTHLASKKITSNGKKNSHPLGHVRVKKIKNKNKQKEGVTSIERNSLKGGLLVDRNSPIDWRERNFNDPVGWFVRQRSGEHPGCLVSGVWRYPAESIRERRRNCDEKEIERVVGSCVREGGRTKSGRTERGTENDKDETREWK